MKAALSAWIQDQWRFIVPAAVLAAFAYVVGPEMYRRATRPIAVTGAIGSVPISTASVEDIAAQATKTANAERDEALKSAARMAKERDDALKQRDDALARVSKLTKTPSLFSAEPPSISSLGTPEHQAFGQLAGGINPLAGAQSLVPSAKEQELQSELDSKDKQLNVVTKERYSALAQAKGTNEPKKTPAQADRVNWSLDGQLIVASYGGTSTPYVINALIFQGISKTSFHFKEAYLISGLTGHRADLVANVHGPSGGYYPVTAVDVPSDAPVQLDYNFNPPVSVRDLFDQWGKFSFKVVYDDGSSFEHEFSEQEIRKQGQRQMPDAFGPQVTPREKK